MRRLILFSLAVLLPAICNAQTIYSWKVKGKTHYGDQCPSKTKCKVESTTPAPTASSTETSTSTSSTTTTASTETSTSTPGSTGSTYTEPAVSVPSTSGITYYVSASGNDSNNGLSADRAFRTLQKAANLTQPGDTVLIMNGVYTDVCYGCDILRITRSGTPSAWITYRAHPGHTPKIQLKTSWTGIRVAGASHIIIEGLEIEGNAATITYDYAYSQRNNGGNPETNGNCLAIREADGRFSHNIIVRRNRIHHCPGGGIPTQRVDYLTVEDNVVHSNGWWTVWAESGISLLHARDIDTNTGYKNFIRRNVSYYNRNYIPWLPVGKITDGNGIIIDDTQNTSAQTPYRGRTLVENNLVYMNGGSGIHAYKSDNVDIINNTAYMNAATPELQGEIFATRSSNIRILNNVMFARKDKQVNHAPSTNTNVVYDHNVYFNSSNIPGRGPNDIVADPRFVDPASFNFRLQAGSPAIDSGTATLAPKHDIEGRPRPNSGGYDRGAYEAAVSNTK